jgi:ERF superfamily.
MGEVTDTLASALAAFQLELPAIAKGNTANMGTFTAKYADLADISRIVLPLLAKHGLSFSAKPTIDDQGRFVLSYVLRHSGGDSDAGVYPLPANVSPQQVGSAITYARRYALSSITGIAPDEDDDGKAAQETKVDSTERAFMWDPIEQQTLRAAWEAEIEDAKDGAELTEVSSRISAARRPSCEDRISPATFDHLKIAGAAKRAALKEVKSDGDAGDRQSAQVPEVQ